MDAPAILAELAERGLPAVRLCLDSRSLAAGEVFVALPGTKTDGRAHIQEALARGATAILYEADGAPLSLPPGSIVPALAVEGLAQQLGELAHLTAGKPSEQLRLIAVTGTNGKTSVTHWIAQCLTLLKRPCGLIGTLGAGLPNQLKVSANTTPDAVRLQYALAELVGQGAQACALEASSIGLAAGRLNGVRITTAVFTNLTRDHLDYHGDMAAYAAAKARLFDWTGLQTAVINLDDPLGAALAQELAENGKIRVVGYRIASEEQEEGKATEVFSFPRAEPASASLCTELVAHDLRMTHEGMTFTLPGVRIHAPLVGRFNAANLLAVIAVLQTEGFALPAIAEAVKQIKPPSGRMEFLGGDGQPLVVIDYAHTPDALENALKALRAVAQARAGRLFCVFGCGGDRDSGKRPLMGAVAERLAAVSVVTSDNPRSEEPQTIIRHILNGMKKPALVEIDRARAIRAAILLAEANDVVLIAGKGHEPYQEAQGVRHPFVDSDHAQQALKALP